MTPRDPMPALPTEIETEDLFPSGTRYRLPRRRMGKIALLPLLGGFAIFAFMAFWTRDFVGGFVGVLGPAGMLAGLVAAPGFFAACCAMAIGLAMVAGRSEIEVSAGELRLTERLGPFRYRRQAKTADLIRFTITKGPTSGETTGPNAAAFLDLGAIRVERATGKPLWAALAYSFELLRPLADTLAVECGPESHSFDSRDAPPAVKVIDVVEEEPEPDDAIAPGLRCPYVPSQPAGSKVTLEAVPDGVALLVPPAGVMRGSFGLFFFAVTWLGFMTIFTFFFGFASLNAAAQNIQSMWEVVGVVAFMGAFWSIGIGLMLTAVNMGRRQAALAVANGRLMIVQTSLFGTKKREWACENLRRIGIGPSGMSVNDVPVLELQIHPHDEKKHGMLAGRETQELAWIATVLRDAGKVGAAVKEPPAEHDVEG
jgi:hypothetical protein